MLQCLLVLNGLSVLPFEILFEEFYNKAVKKSLWNQMEMQSLILLWGFFWSVCLALGFLGYFKNTFRKTFKCCREMAKEKKNKCPFESLSLQF